MRNRLDEELEQLGCELIEMGAMIERAIAGAVKALLENDAVTAREIAATDGEIDQKERDIERRCLRLLLQQQPVARDLRLVSAALKMITDMERIGDQAEDIAEIVVLLGDRPARHIDHIGEMARITIQMVSDSIDAFVKKDLALVRAVIARDDAVDALFVQVRGELVRMIAHSPAQGEQAIDYLMIAKYLERIGDHATNIAEWVEFSITGAHPSAQDE